MNITILGCGVYGLALANSFNLNKDNKITVWNKFEKEILECREKYLDINFTTDLEGSIIGTDLIVIAIPVAFLSDTLISLKAFYNNQDILIASKGIDTKTHKFAYSIVMDTLNTNNIGVMSGGTFASDMMEKKVMGLTVATKSDSIKKKVNDSLNVSFLKLQYTSDIIGTSVCSAIKNVMAIGFGILDGANYPPSSRFLFLTEAIYEISNLIMSLGGDAKTVMGYAGLDDIMMTCTSSQSRNYTMGSLIGKRCDKEEIINYKSNTTIEGFGTAKAIYDIALEKGLKLPITTVIYKILYENTDFQELINLLEKKS